MTKLLYSCMDSISLKSKDDIFNEFVPYILKALKNISLETKEYSDALIADYSFNIHSLLLKCDRESDGIRQQLLTEVLLKRSFQTDVIRIAIIECCLPFLKPDPNWKNTSLPCSIENLPVVLALYVHENESSSSYWWPVYSFGYLFEIYVEPLANLLKISMREHHLIGNLISSLTYIAAKISSFSITRNEVFIYMPLFDALLTCITRQDLGSIQKTSTRAFEQIFVAFKPDAQCIILRCMFTKILDGTIKVSAEPQVLALLTDIFRRNLAPNSIAYDVFASELTYFYGQCVDALYEDIEHGVYLYNAFLLLVRFQALRRLHLPLLNTLLKSVFPKISSRITDFLRLKELQPEKQMLVLGMENQMEFLQFNFKQTEATIKDVLSNDKK
uniref:Uncharacterized protein n=1 Tax=Acrobeloides nanus TaxID=290746 RepID=A0A914EB47_9BILA